MPFRALFHYITAYIYFFRRKSRFQSEFRATPDNMQSLAILLPMLASLPLTLAVPSFITARSSTCDQYSPVQAGSYAVQNDAWGQSSGSGSQCSQINGQNGGGVSWSTTFTWDGGQNNIKSYANAEASANTPCNPLNQYHKIPTTWSWRYVKFIFPCKSPQPCDYSISVWRMIVTQTY